MTRRRVRDAMLGTAGLVAFVLVVALSIALYNQDFVSSTPITIEAARAGLLMEPGAAVELHGVVVGRVHSVSTHGGGAVISVHLDPKMLTRIPADVSADVVPPTVFGAKYINLIPQADTPASTHIERGAVISDAHVTVEINSTFDAVIKALQAVPPGKLSTALSSVANTLSGRGAQIGQLIRQTNSLLTQFNPSLPALAADLPGTTAIANLYADVTPNLITTATNAGTVSNTVVERQAQLAAFLVSFTRLGNTTAQALAKIQHVLPITLNALQPTVQLLDRYSPELPCLFGGLVRNDGLLSAVFGGPAFGGAKVGGITLTVNSASLPAYRFPSDLPVDGANTGPDCHGLPDINTITPYVNYDVGTHIYKTKKAGTAVSDVPLSVLLFGVQPPIAVGTK